MAAFQDIRNFLHGVRRRLGVASAVEGVAFLALAVSCLVAAATLAAWVGDGEQLLTVRVAAATCVGLSLLVALTRYVFLPWRRLRRDVEIARHVERASPALKGGVLSCVEFEAELPEIQRTGRFSMGLIGALADDTARRLATVRPGDLVSWEQPRRLGQAFLGVAVLLGAAVFLFPDPFTEGARALVHGVPARAERELAPGIEERDVVVGDISYTLSYPAYTQLPSRTLRNTAGDATALVGTHVHISTHSLVPALKAELVFDDDPERPIPLQVDGDRLTGEITVKRDALFRFQVTRPDGTLVVERARRVLDAEEDSPPTIDLLKPTEDLEVRTDNPVRLYFSAADDFGISRVDVVTSKVDDPAPPVRRRVVSASGERSYVGEGSVDLKQIALEPGDTVVAWLEVYDNNTVAEEPRKAESRKVRIKLHSVKERHNENIEAQRKLVEQMLDLLADRLESPIEEQSQARYDRSVGAQRKIARSTALFITTAEALAEALRQDPLNTAGVHDVLDDMVKRYRTHQENEMALLAKALGETRSSERLQNLAQLFRSNESAITDLETDIPWLDELIDQQHQREVVDRAKELVDAHRELMDLMEQLKKTGDPALKMELQRKIGDLIKDIDKLMAEMRRNAKPIPYENMNLDGMEPGQRSTDLRDMRGTLEKMQDLLRDGKIDEAMAMAEGLGQAVHSLTAELESEMEQMTAGGQFAEDQWMQKMSGDLDRAINRQDSVHNQTSELDEKARKQLSELIQKQLAPQIAEEMERVRRLQRQLSALSPEELHPDDAKSLGQLQKLLQDLNSNLSQEDLNQAVRKAREAVDELRDLQREVSVGADRMAEREGQTQRTRKRQKASRQLRYAKPTARQIARNLEKMMPNPDDLLDRRSQRQIDRLAEHQERVRERVERMRSEIREREAQRPGSAGDLPQALDEAERAMRDSRQRMEEHQPGRAEGHAEKALEQLKEAQQALQKQMGQQRQGSDAPGVGQQRKPVEIPDAERYTVPKEFRDELLRSLKERAPERYRPLIEQYYEALVQ